MPTDNNAEFRTCLKSNNTIKLSSDASIVHITYESITNFVFLSDFDTKTIESLPTNCKEKIPDITDDPAAGITDETVVLTSNISSIAIFRLIVVDQSAKY